MPWVWVAIAAIIAFITFGALFAIVNPPGISGEQHNIHLALGKAENDWGLLPAGPGKEQAKKIIADLEGVELRSKAARGTMARVLLILRQQADPADVPDFGSLNAVKDRSADALTPRADSARQLAEVNDALRELYTAEKLSQPQAEELADKLGDYGARWPMDLAAMRALELSDKKGGVTARQAGVVIVALGLFLGGIVSLLLILVKPKPKGLPVNGSSGTGDSLGVRFLLFVIAFVGASFVAGMLMALGVSDERASLLIVEIVLIAFVLAILRLPINGRAFTPAEIGLKSTSVAGDVGYGLLGFLANLPVIAALAWFGMEFLRWIPSGGHPIENQLLDMSNLPLLILTAGPITAVLEELTFRGLLFQGLAQKMRVWPAVVLSSLAFAMIHPQGGALWLSLAWVGGMAAYLTYQRKSLVPAIVMHACHNTTLILLAAYASGAK
jgi:membrane protease YdiL (CAAX protease family)